MIVVAQAAVSMKGSSKPKALPQIKFHNQSIYNADGTLTGTDSIKEIVHAWMIIQEHVELISFGAT